MDSDFSRKRFALYGTYVTHVASATHAKSCSICEDHNFYTLLLPKTPTIYKFVKHIIIYKTIINFLL